MLLKNAILGSAVSRETIEIVIRTVEAINRGDVDEAISYLDEDYELHSAIIGGAAGAIYRGHDGARRWFADTQETFDELRTDPSEFRDLGDRVLMFGQIHARGRESGLELDSPTGWVLALRDGKIVKAEGFMSWAEALLAAGLSE
jgi:ketosteroid isomerase-like protein